MDDNTFYDIFHDEYMELNEDFIVLAVPEDTVQVEIAATIYIDGKLKRVARVMGFPEVRAAFKEANDGYMPSDAIFSLRPMGEEKVTALVEKYLTKERFGKCE